MASFVIRPLKWAAIRLFGRNPLVRTSDRVEAAVFTLAAVLVVLAGPGAATVGMTVYHNEIRESSAQAHLQPAVAVTENAGKSADPLYIRAAGTGHRGDQPSPAEAAEMDALVTAVAIWLIVVLFSGFTTAAVAVHLAIVRDARWDLDLRSLAENGGGRTSAP